MRRPWKTIAEHAIVALVVISVFELGLLYKIRAASGLYSSDTKFALPSGYLSDGKFSPPGSSPCFLIRLSADGCRYCRIDRPQYTKLVERARRAGCTSTILAPKSGQLNFKGDGWGTVNLQFVDLQLGRALNPFSTPQTILLGKAGDVIWYRDGAMNDRALSNAIAALEKVH